MSIRTDAEKVLAGVSRLAEAYETNKGRKLEQVTITPAQKEALEKAIAAEKINMSGLCVKPLEYRGVALRVRD